ncbi:MAG: radical SAM family heme chaperone HemW [Terriglobales bacterium]
MPLGIYISVPFCRTKCSFCNFASGVVSKAVFARYVDRVTSDIAGSDAFAAGIGARWERAVDSIYLGGGTPTVLEIEQLARLFDAVRRKFEVAKDAEITVECAPGTLTGEMIDTLVRCGVNRVSLGVQSFVDEEARSVGRLHTRAIVLDGIRRLREAGISNLSIDLIAGLPHQTPESWEYSLAETIGTGAPHVSVYMLEIDEDSRLGKELIAGGTRYHAHFVPDEDTTADLYELACARLNAAGIEQYEISNFARPGCESRHNLKYWTRAPYLGFGVDAHSMLPAAEGAVRFATPDTLEEYVAGKAPSLTTVDRDAAIEEEHFLGLRLNRGIDPAELASRYGSDAEAPFEDAIEKMIGPGLLERDEGRVRLTARGRLLSNEVFQRFLRAPA